MISSLINIYSSNDGSVFAALAMNWATGAVAHGFRNDSFLSSVQARRWTSWSHWLSSLSLLLSRLLWRSSNLLRSSGDIPLRKRKIKIFKKYFSSFIVSYFVSATSLISGSSSSPISRKLQNIL